MLGGGFHTTHDGNPTAAEDVGDFGGLQPRGVVFKREQLAGFVCAEAAQAVGVGKFPQPAELFGGERLLQFETDVDECHAHGL